MTRNINVNLNQAVLQIPANVVITSKWLSERGVSAKLAWWYVHSNWLERIGENAFKKPNEKISWGGVLFALQNQLQLPIHVAGKSSLLILGKAHFIPLNSHQVLLRTEYKLSLPRWVFKENLTLDNIIINNSELLSQHEKQDTILREVNGLELYMSCPELAILEVLADIPKSQDFQEAALLMEGLKYLRPILIQSLLERCTSIKVKRLFLYLANYYNHNWLKNIDTVKIDLGKGKRVIAGGGNYNPVYQISVPKINKDN